MQHFGVGTCAAFTVKSACIILLVFGLINDVVDHYIIYLHIAVSSVIGKGNTKFTFRIGIDCVIQHANAEGPGFDGLPTNFQADALIADYTTHAYGNTVTAAAI